MEAKQNLNKGEIMLSHDEANHNHKMSHRAMHSNSEQLALCKQSLRDFVKGSKRHSDLCDVIAKREAEHLVLMQKSSEDWIILMETKGYSVN